MDILPFLKKNPWLEWGILMIILLAALAFRLDYALYDLDIGFAPDSQNYDEMVRNLLDNGIYSYPSGAYESDEPNAYVTPGYPLFLTAIYSIIGPDNPNRFVAVRVIQSVIFVIGLLCLYLTAKQIINPVAGYITAGLGGAYPTYIKGSSTILTEPLFFFFISAYLLLLVKSYSHRNVWLHGLTGLIFGMAVLTRPSVMPVFIIPWLFVAWRYRYHFSWSSMVAQTIGVLMIVFPWGMRNLFVLGHLYLFSEHVGDPLISGIVPYANPSEALAEVPYEGKNRIFAALEYILQGFWEQPLLFLSWFTVGKLNLLFAEQWIQTGVFSKLDFLHWAILGLGASGALAAIWLKKLQLFLFMGLMLVAVQLPFVAEPRFAFGIIPFLLLLAGWPFSFLKQGRNKDLNSDFEK